MMFEIKTDMNMLHLSLHILAMDSEFDYPKRCFTYDNLAKPGLSQGNPSSKTALTDRFLSR